MANARVLNPFLRFRERLDSYDAVRHGRISDDHFVAVVSRLDAAVADIDGRGFSETPVENASALARAIGYNGDLWVKVEANNVADSHKARHLFGVAIHMALDSIDTQGSDVIANEPPLAIASCGNAALAAGVLAAAMKRQLDVFVPTWADEEIVERLSGLGARVQRCPRVDGEAGDPAYLRYREAVSSGASPFTVQGTDTPTTFDGGRTIGYELADQVGSLDALFIQVGGGALATSVSQATPNASLFPVQTEGCAPLARAWDRLTPDFDFISASRRPDHYMWPWEGEPASIATGILDDVTYDWLPLLTQTQQTAGYPLVAPEPNVKRAYELVQAHTDYKVCATGTSGLAGLITFLSPDSGANARATDRDSRPPESVGLVFSGLDRP